MNRKKKMFMIFLFSAFFALTLGTIALADDDGHDKGEYHENSEYYEHQDDGRYDGYEGEDENYQEKEEYDEEGTGQNSAAVNEILAEYWNIWSRKPLNNPNNTLPITAPSKLTVTVDGKESKLYFIPREGQLLVSGDAIGSLLGADSKYYPQSKIMVISKNKHELIVRADSNAVFENRVKNPMPVKVAVYEKTIYLPVSVAANALGYRITWKSDANMMLLESI